MAPPSHFSNISTRSELDAARYHRAVRAYAGALLQNDDDADEVSQEVVCELQRGGYSLRWCAYARRRVEGQATLPFRRFLQRAVYWAAMDRLRDRGRAATRPLVGFDLNQLEDAAPPPHEQADLVWEAECGQADRVLRQAVIDRAWRRFEEAEQGSSGPGYATLLELKADRPEATTEQLADAYFGRRGRAVAAETVRVWLSRARERFAALLMAEVRPLLPDGLADDLASQQSAREELRQLRLTGFFSGEAGDDTGEPPQEEDL